jgi:hypothetical protein
MMETLEHIKEDIFESRHYSRFRGIPSSHPWFCHLPIFINEVGIPRSRFPEQDDDYSPVMDVRGATGTLTFHDWVAGSLSRVRRADFSDLHDLARSPGELQLAERHISTLCNDFLEALVAGGSWKRTAEPAVSAVRPSREKEIKWLHENIEYVNTFAGKWIVVEGNELLASSTNLPEVIDTARKRGIVSPFVFFVPEPIPGDTVGI